MSKDVTVEVDGRSLHAPAGITIKTILSANVYADYCCGRQRIG
jgi:hypothetical protein